MRKSSRNNSLEQTTKEREQRKGFSSAPGYGDKKLEGPNRPAE
ncbi:MAG: hypothetical protein ACE3JP_10630 [Ectobacillus sp.]